jgi:DNA-binding HxlR family transcriptional regulator
MNEKTETYIDPDRKSYNQVCPLATALDFVGDRWTILIIRELLGGSARFQELRDGLPGIASNLLTERLRRLEADGLVRQIHAHNTVLYTLTEQGAEIRMALEELAFWAARMERRAAPVLHERSSRAIAMALQSVLVRAGDALPTERLVVELEVDGEYIEVVLDQRPTVTVRLSIEPDARVRVSAAGISAVLRGQGDDSTFTHLSGNEAATKYLVAALS